MVRWVLAFSLAMMVFAAGAAGNRASATANKVPCWIDVPAGETAECYRVRVPVYSDDDAPPHFYRLPVAVLKARAANPAADPVIVIQGGPGASFFHSAYPEQVSTEYLWAMTEPVRETRDVVIYDQRGVGLAEPALNCHEADGRAASAASPPGVEVPFYDRERDELARCYDRLVAAGIDLSSFTTPANADDLAVIIEALGYDQVNLWGMSYGTRVALVMLRRHGNLIRSVVLDGVYPPHIRADEQAPWATHRAFTRIFDDCARDAWCTKAYGDIGDRFAELLESLNEKPQAISVDDPRWPIGSEAVLDGDLLIFHMYDALYYGDAIPYVPALIDDALNYDLSGLGWFYWYPFIADWALDEGTFLSVTCREEMPRIRDDVVAKEIQKYGVYAMAGSTIMTDDICDAWPVPPLEPAEWEPVESDVPALLISGAYDPVTPPDWGEDAARYLLNGRHVEFLGAGHVPSAANRCASDLVAAFFDDPDPAALSLPDCRLFTEAADFSSVDW